MNITFTDPESKLVRLCKKGDAKAQYKLYNQYVKGMYNIAVRMTGDHEQAEDILQDSFIKAFTEINKLQNDKAFAGWLKRIVVNLCIDATRRKRIVFTDMEKISAKHLEVEAQVENTTDPEFVHHYIKKLPDGARQILVLRALEGYRHAEIAEKLDISESTAKTQYFRAKQLLAKMINKAEHETESGKLLEGESLKA